MILFSKRFTNGSERIRIYPMRTIRSTLCSSRISAISASNYSRVMLAGSTKIASYPCSRVRSRAYADSLFESTHASSMPGILPAFISSMIAWRSVPFVEAKTPILNVSIVIVVVIESYLFFNFFSSLCDGESA